MKNNNPKYIGPGYWASFHRKCFKADTMKAKVEAMISIHNDIFYFPCNTCKEDSLRYLSKNPLEEVLDDTDDLALFKWTVDFHNHVNNKLGKRQVSYDEAIELWSDNGVCIEKSCDHESDSDEDQN